MDLTQFLTDLLVKPETEANRILLRIVKILFILLLALAFWFQLGGILEVPKEFNLVVLFRFFVSGQIIIPIFTVLIVSILIKFMENFLLPMIIAIMSFLIKSFFSVFFYIRFYTLRNKQVKKAVAIMSSIGFIQIQYKKIKKGVFFRIYKFYANHIDIAKISKEHLIVISNLIQIFCIWILVIEKGNFCPDIFFTVVKIVLIILIIYVPFNLSILHLISSFKNPVEDLISLLEKQQNPSSNDNNSTN